MNKKPKMKGEPWNPPPQRTPKNEYRSIYIVLNTLFSQNLMIIIKGNFRNTSNPFKLNEITIFYRGLLASLWFCFWKHWLIIMPMRPHSLSGCIDKVVALHAESCTATRSNPISDWAGPIYTMHEVLRGYCPWGWGCYQSILSTVSNAIVCSWLWSTATRSSPLGYFNRLLK